MEWDFFILDINIYVIWLPWSIPRKIEVIRSTVLKDM